jgi:NO-binding membrane sensor protein with MHYT domain
MVTSYNPRLVAPSILISILASYAALDLAGRVTAAREVSGWRGSDGACAMGMGVWSMHYIGLLAFSLPITDAYDWTTVAASLLCAILPSGVALFAVSHLRMGVPLAGLGSVAMGGGIVATHYNSMAAMRLPAECSYSPVLVSAVLVGATIPVMQI